MTPSREADSASRLSTTAWALVGALIVALIIPWLFQRGMFWDGVIFATIARNMTVGVGDAWHPVVTRTFMAHFHEHPPLAFWLQVILFQVLGDQLWVERLYGLLTAAATLPILIATWRWLLRDNPQSASAGWLGLALWAPWGAWSYRHNMLENTMGIFTALAVYASLRALDSARRFAPWSVLAGLSILAALLSKGPVGLFPAVKPLVGWLTLRRATVRRALVVELGLLIALGAGCAAASASQASRDYLLGYWQEQFLASLSGEREKAWTHFNILLWLLGELRMPVGVAACLILLSRRLSGRWLRDVGLAGPKWFCIVTAMSASLPISLSPKQAGHYATPSWPFYTFAVALWCLPAVLDLLHRASWLADPRPQRVLRTLAAATVVAAAVVSAARYGRCGRDREVIAAADQVAASIAADAILTVEPTSWNRLSPQDRLKFHVYLYRYHRVSVFVDEPGPILNLAIHRLDPPRSGLVASDRSITTDGGLVCHLLSLPPTHRMAAAPAAVR